VIIENTSLKTSRIGLGTHALHRLISARRRQDLLSLAYELGIAYFDTAPSYGAGLTERELGHFIPSRRSQVVLTTKFGIPISRMAAAAPGWNQAAMVLRAARKLVAGRKRPARSLQRDYSPQRALASVENSLRALRTDHIDILYLHEPTATALPDADPLLHTLEALKASGKVRHVGLSGQVSECARLRSSHPALGEVLQVEVPAAPDGSPAPLGTLQPPAAVHFWEFASGSTAGVRRTAELLARSAPNGVLLVSSIGAAQLRETVATVGQFDSAAAGSATSALA
jgi:aryl-alcohol dehydrogenase-like predicted oxidoreductase